MNGGSPRCTRNHMGWGRKAMSCEMLLPSKGGLGWEGGWEKGTPCEISMGAYLQFQHEQVNYCHSYIMLSANWQIATSRTLPSR